MHYSIRVNAVAMKTIYVKVIRNAFYFEFEARSYSLNITSLVELCDFQTPKCVFFLIKSLLNTFGYIRL